MSVTSVIPASFQRQDIARNAHNAHHAHGQNRRSGALRDRLKDRHALHMMRHRKDVGLGDSRKTPGQMPFFGTSVCIRTPRASNERHGRQSGPRSLPTPIAKRPVT